MMIIDNRWPTAKTNAAKGDRNMPKYIKHLSYDNMIFEREDYVDFTSVISDESANVEDNLIDTEKEYLINELLLDVKEWLKLRSEKIEGAYYDEKLFNKYFSGGMTFREIADETKIPLSEIFNSIAGTNEIVLTKFEERYDGLINN